MKRKSIWKAVASIMISMAMHSGIFAQTQDDITLQEIYKEIDEKYSKRVEQAFKKDMGRVNKMKSELEEVDKIKDNPGKKKGLDNYKSANKENYGKAIREAGVNLNQLLAELQRKYPAYSFSIIDDYAISIERKGPAQGSLSSMNNQENLYEEQTAMAKLNGPNAENMYSTAYEAGNTFQELAFTQSRSVACHVASGGGVEFGARRIRAFSTGVVGGSCTAMGDIRNRTVLPATAQAITLNLSGTVECTGFALATLGFAFTVVDSYVSASIEGVTSLSDLSSRTSKSVMAPFLWFASINEYKSFNYSINVTQWKGRTLLVLGSSYSNSVAAACCGTTSSGRTTINTANLSIR